MVNNIPLFFKVLYIPGGAGFLPSTICIATAGFFASCFPDPLFLVAWVTWGCVMAKRTTHGNPRVELITDFMEHGSNVSSGASNFRILRVLRMGQRQKRENTRGEKRRQ